MKYNRSTARQWVKENLKGYSVCTTTALTEDKELDIKGMKENVELFLALPGVEGLYIGSLYQEFWTLTLDERKRLTEAMLEQVDGRVPVIVNVTENCSKNSIDLAHHAQRAGADLVMHWPPYYGPRNNEGIFAFYSDLCSAIDIGVATYTSTLHELGFYIDVPLMQRLAGIETIVAAKEASLSLARYTAMMDACSHLLPISAPLEEYYFYGKIAYPETAPDFILGSSRPTYMQSAERPYCAEFFAAIREGDFSTAAKAMNSIIRVANELHSSFLSKGTHHATLYKYITSLLGFAAGPVRAPLTMPTAEEKEFAHKVLSDNGLASGYQLAAE